MLPCTGLSAGRQQEWVFSSPPHACEASSQSHLQVHGTEGLCNIAAGKERRIESYRAGFFSMLKKNKQSLPWQFPCRFGMKAKSLLPFSPHVLWGHSFRNIWVHQILSGGRNVSADSQAGNYWSNCQLGHSYSYLLSLWELISNNPVPSTNRWEQRTLPGIRQLVALEMRYLIAIKLTGSATGTHSEK